MAKNIVRSSKFRHVFGTPAKKDKWYDNLRITEAPHESDMSAVNCKFLAVVVKVQGGGSFIVAPLDKVGRFDINYPKVAGHKNPVLDVAWNPFDDNEIASASEDGTIKLWSIPDGGIKENMTEPTLTLEGHQRKVMHLRWHPSAANVLASASADNHIIVWNTETGGQLMKSSEMPEMIQSICWNKNGSLIALTCKDKNIRVMDARTGEIKAEGRGHEGNKPSRVVFCGNDRLFTSGFRASDRQYALWNTKSLGKPLCIENIDTGSGVQFPFYDEGTGMVYLVGKGDTQFRYFEVTDDDQVFFLSMYQSKDPARSVCSMPKRHLEYMKCEVMRFYKLTKTHVEPIAMTVPRKSDMFQDDIYPPCPAGRPALSAEDWIGGMDKDPVVMDIREGGGGGGGGGGAGGPVALKAAAPKKKVVTKKAAKISVDGGSKAGVGEPLTLEEYREAYKKLLEENKMLKEKLGM